MNNRRKKVENSKYQKRNVVKVGPPKVNRVGSSRNIKASKQELIVIIGVAIFVTIVSGLLFGPEITLITLAGWIIIYLFNNIASKISQGMRKILSVLNIIICFGFGLALISGMIFLSYIVVKAPKFDGKILNVSETSNLYDKYGKQFAKVGAQRREKVEFNEISSNLISGVIATEDARFFSHNGLDPYRFFVASIKQVLGKGGGGASTLSMQVVGNYFTNRDQKHGIHGIMRKFTDIYLSVFKLEKQYNKQEIFEFYINNLFAGNNSFGVEQASIGYFGKSSSELTLPEAAVLAGIYQAPSLYDPIRNPKTSEARRNQVLYLMQRHGYITKEERQIASSIPVKSLVNPTNKNNNKFQIYIDEVLRELKLKGFNPSNQSLDVYTNLDPEKQLAMNKIMNGETFKFKDNLVQVAMIALESKTGKIEAIGGGRNRKPGDLNLATDTRIKKQSGSVAKPIFAYAPGVEFLNWSTGEVFVDEPHSYTNGKPVQNSDQTFWGPVTLRKALAYSRNIPALKAFQATDRMPGMTKAASNKKKVEFIKKLGITPELENGYMHEAHALGAFNGTNVLEISAAYAAIANGGYYNKPYTVSKVVNRKTKQETEFIVEPVKAMEDSTAFIVAEALRTSVTEGLAKRVVPAGWKVGAKTGTTNYDPATVKSRGLPKNAIPDLWVAGFDSETTLAMWYGYDKIYPHNTLIAGYDNVNRDRLYSVGAQAVFKHYNNDFPVPDSVKQVPVIISGNKIYKAPEGAPADVVSMEWFKAGTEPTKYSYSFNKLPNVNNLKAKRSGNSLVLSWDKVQEPDADEEERKTFGKFGYRIYLNDRLLEFTTKNTYTIKPYTEPAAIIKVVTTYDTFTSNASSGALLNYKEEPKELNILLKDGINNGKKYKLGKFKPSVSQMIVQDETHADITSDPAISKTIKITRISPNAESNVNPNDLNIIPGQYAITYHAKGYGLGASVTVTITIE